MKLANPIISSISARRITNQQQPSRLSAISSLKRRLTQRADQLTQIAALLQILSWLLCGLIVVSSTRPCNGWLVRAGGTNDEKRPSPISVNLLWMPQIQIVLNRVSTWRWSTPAASNLIIRYAFGFIRKSKPIWTDNLNFDAVLHPSLRLHSPHSSPDGMHRRHHELHSPQQKTPHECRLDVKITRGSSFSFAPMELQCRRPLEMNQLFHCKVLLLF
jgi:hypothetical protein